MLMLRRNLSIFVYFVYYGWYLYMGYGVLKYPSAKGKYKDI